MNDLDLPPRRTLPPDVRARLRTHLDTGPEPPHGARSRAPLAVAAGVALLAAGAVLVAQSTGGNPDEVQPGKAPATTTAAPAPDATLNPSDMKAVIDHCVAATDGNGYPPRDAWEPVFGAREHGVTVVMARAGGKPYACQLTANSVTMSNPQGEVPRSPGTSAGVLLNTPEGLVAGVAEPAWQHVGVFAMDGANVMTSTVAETRDGMFFLIRGSEKHVNVRLYNAVGDNADPPSWEEAPPLGTETGTVTVINRNNQSVAPEDQDLFGQCVAANPEWDADGWSPGAGMTWLYDGRVVLLRNQERIAVCRHYPKPADGVEYEVKARGTHQSGWAPCRLADVTPVGDDSFPPIGGVVTTEAGYVDVWFHGSDRPIRKAVVNGTFVLQTPFPNAEIEKVDVYDPDGAKHHSGPLPAC